MDMLGVFHAWDGKTIATLRAVADKVGREDHAALLAACRDTDQDVARAASWVLKAVCERGGDPTFPADVLSGDPHWEVALHLLQSIQHTSVDLPPEMTWRYLDHVKPIVRAWALDAYVRLGAVDAEERLAQAATDPAASVRARARNLKN